MKGRPVRNYIVGHTEPVTMDKNGHLLRHRNSTRGALFAFIANANKLSTFFERFRFIRSNRTLVYNMVIKPGETVRDEYRNVFISDKFYCFALMLAFNCIVQ